MNVTNFYWQVLDVKTGELVKTLMVDSDVTVLQSSTGRFATLDLMIVLTGKQNAFMVCVSTIQEIHQMFQITPAFVKTDGSQRVRVTHHAQSI